MKKSVGKSTPVEKAKTFSAVVNPARVLTEVRLLERYFSKHPSALTDAGFEWIEEVMTACQKILMRKAMTTGDGTAIGALHRQTCFSIEGLNYFLKNEKSRAALAEKAANSTVWPVMVSNKESSFDAARNKIKEIGLGGSADSNFKPLASRLRSRIEAFIDLLNYTQSTPLRREIQEANLPIALEWENAMPRFARLTTFQQRNVREMVALRKGYAQRFWANHHRRKRGFIQDGKIGG